MLNFLCIGLVFSAASQGVFNNNTNQPLAKIIADSPNGFKNIKGEIKYSAAGTRHYASVIELEDAVQCMISNMGAGDEFGIWNSVILETALFEEAEYRYKLEYEKISNTIIRQEGEKPYILNGEYHRPNNHKEIVSSRFNMLPNSGPLKNVLVVLVMEKINKSYRISLHVMQDEEGRLVLH